jgi:hypothetical protein
MSERGTLALIKSVSDWYKCKHPESGLVLSHTDTDPNSDPHSRAVRRLQLR